MMIIKLSTVDNLIVKQRRKNLKNRELKRKNDLRLRKLHRRSWQRAKMEALSKLKSSHLHRRREKAMFKRQQLKIIRIRTQRKFNQRLKGQTNLSHKSLIRHLEQVSEAAGPQEDTLRETQWQSNSNKNHQHQETPRTILSLTNQDPNSKQTRERRRQKSKNQSLKAAK